MNRDALPLVVVRRLRFAHLLDSLGSHVGRHLSLCSVGLTSRANVVERCWTWHHRRRNASSMARLPRVETFLQLRPKAAKRHRSGGISPQSSSAPLALNTPIRHDKPHQLSTCSSLGKRGALPHSSPASPPPCRPHLAAAGHDSTMTATGWPRTFGGRAGRMLPLNTAS